MKTLMRAAVVKADEPKVASRAVLLLFEELVRELQLNGFNPADFDGEISIRFSKKVKA